MNRTIWIVSGLLVGNFVCQFAQGQSTNRYNTGGNYNINAPSQTNLLKQWTTTNAVSGADDNLVWAHSGRYLATDRSDLNVVPPANPKFVNLLSIGRGGNVTNLGPRSSAVNFPVYANVTDFTWNDDRVLFGYARTNVGSRCKLMSCTVTGPVQVAEFLKDPVTNFHVYSPSVIYDPVAQKQRLLFLTSTNGNKVNPTETNNPPIPGNVLINCRWQVCTVTFTNGGVPDWNTRTNLTAFTNNLVLESAKWCPELGTNFMPLANRYALMYNTGNPTNKRLYVFSGVQGILDSSTLAPSNFADARFDLREGEVNGNSQMSWTFDGKFLMYSIWNSTTTNNELYLVTSYGATNRINFPTPSYIRGQEQWPCISPNGMQAAFTVNKRVFMLPLQCENNAVTNFGTTNIISDGGYTLVRIPGSALPSMGGMTNYTFTVVEPTDVDTNQFPSEYAGNSREFSVSGISSQFNFMTNVEMSLHFEDSDVPDGVSETNMTIFLYNAQTNSQGRTGTWTQCDALVDTNSHYVTSSNIQHFSVYALGQKLTTPSAPTSLNATKGTYSDRVQLTWDAGVNATSFEVWYNTINNSGTATKFGTEPEALAFTNTSVTVDRIYYYWVKAKNSSGTSDFSLGDYGYATNAVSAPAAPAGLSATKGSYTNRVQLTWNASSGAATYEVYRNTVNSSATATKFDNEPATTAYADTNSTVNIVYFYWVKAKNGAGASGFSSGDYGYATNAITSPDVPTGLVASKGAHTDRVQLDWSAAGGASSYEVYRNIVDDSDSASKLNTEPVSPSFQDADINIGVRLYYWVKAKNSVGTSTLSSGDNGYLGVGTWSLGADFDGDRLADPAMVDNSTGWFCWSSMNNYQRVSLLTTDNMVGGIPLAGDFDGDRKADPGIFLFGNWYIWLSSGNYSMVGPLSTFYTSWHNYPAVADFDGDRLSDLAVLDLSDIPSYSLNWFIWLSSSGYLAQVGPLAGYWLGSGYPLAADFDGDGMADFANYYDAWTIWLSSANYSRLDTTRFVVTGAMPTVADYDGDNIADPALCINGDWYVWFSGSSYAPLGPVPLSVP